MDARTMLNSAFSLDRDVFCKLEQICHLQELKKGVGKAGNLERKDLSVRLKDLERLQQEIGDDIQRLLSDKQRLAEQIDSLEKPEIRAVLQLRYLCGYTWERIAEKLNYSTMHIHRLHNRGLSEFQKLLLERAS